MNGKMFLAFYSIEMRRIMSYRVAFWIQFFSSVLVPLVTAWFLWDAMFQHTGRSTFGGYNFDQMVFYYLLTGLVLGLSRCPSLKMSEEIYEGGLTKYILYPINYFAVSYVTVLASASFGVLKFFGGIALFLFIVGMPDGLDLTLSNTGLFFLVCLLSLSMSFLMDAIVELTALWIDMVWSIRVMVMFIVNFGGGSILPLSLLPEWLQNAIAWMPFPYVVWFPINVFMGKVNSSDFLFGCTVILGWLFIFGGCLFWVWRRGKYQYTGVGI